MRERHFNKRRVATHSAALSSNRSKAELYDNKINAVFNNAILNIHCNVVIKNIFLIKYVEICLVLHM